MYTAILHNVKHVHAARHQAAVQLSLDYAVTHHRWPGLVSELFRTPEGRSGGSQVKACSMPFACELYFYIATLATGERGRQRSLEQTRRCHGDALFWLHSSCGNYMGWLTCMRLIQWSSHDERGPATNRKSCYCRRKQHTYWKQHSWTDAS